MNLFELSAKITADTRDYEKAVKNATKVSKSLKDIMERSATQSETNKNKIKVLASEYSSAKAKVATLTTAFNKAAQEEGVTAERTKQLAKELQEAERESSDLKGQLDELTKKSKGAGDGFSKLGSALGKGLATAAKIGTAAVGAAASGIAALTGAAVKNYAEYEQLVGGVETLFGKSADTVMKYAENAYKTAGLSANEYMATVTSFSASLLQSVGGDTDKAADYANRALTDMSDNANKMGTSMELIQNAYNGFAKANYTMLDNLKLGYGGTKEEMARLIKEAAAMTDVQKELGIAVDATDMSFANIVKAINVVQTKMGITGTTAKEAGRTIEGSVNAMKAAWTNLVTGIADKNADLEGLVGDFVTSIVGDGTENNLGVLGNIMPAVKTALNGASTLVSKMIPIIVNQIPSIIKDNLPILTKAAVSIVKSLVDGISENQEMLVDTVFETVVFLTESFIEMLPQIVQLGLDLIVSLANGIAENLPTLIPTIVSVVLQIVQTLTNPETLTNILDAAIVLIESLAYGLMDAIPQLVQAALLIVENLVAFLLNPENLAKLIKLAFDIIIAIGAGLISAIPELLKSVTRIITGIVAMFKDADWGKIGTDLVDGFKNGISKAWTNLKTWFKNLFGDLIGIAKKILGIASPSKVFKKIGAFSAEGFGVGFDEAFGDVERDIENALDFNGTTFGVSAYGSYSGVGALSGIGGTTFGTVNINIEGYNAQDDDELAETIAEKLQIMTERRGAVFA